MTQSQRSHKSCIYGVSSQYKQYSCHTIVTRVVCAIVSRYKHYRFMLLSHHSHKSYMGSHISIQALGLHYTVTVMREHLQAHYVIITIAA